MSPRRTRGRPPSFGTVATWTVAALLIGLTACASPSAPQTESDTRTIGPAGGSLQATGSDGNRYTIAFPPGAVDEPTQVTLTAVTGGGLGAFTVAPAGLRLGAPATVELRLPEGAQVPADASLRLDPASSPTNVPTEVIGRTMTASLRFFSVPSDGAGFRALTADLAPLQGGADQIAAAQADCASRLADMQETFDAFYSTNSFEAAVRVFLNAGSLAMLCDDEEAFSTWIDQTTDAACARYEDLVLLARVTAADTYDTFNELIQPVINWFGVMAKLGVECDQPDPPAVTAEKISQYLTFYEGKVNGMAFTAEWDELLEEARKVVTLRGQATLLGVEGSEEQLDTQVLFPIMDLLRDRGYDECVDTADHYYLYFLMLQPFESQRIPIGSVGPLGHHAGFADSDIVKDIQYCSSSLSVEVWKGGDLPEELTDRRVELEPADEPGQVTDSEETRGPVQGNLVLRGDIERFRCGPTRRLVEHELVVVLAGQEEHRSPTLNAAPDIDIEATLQAAGLDTTGLNTVELWLRRESDACDGLYGDTDHKLFTVSYEADPAPVASSASASPSVLPAETDGGFTFTIAWSDPGENLSSMRVRYDLAGSVQSETVDLTTSDRAHGFTGRSGQGTYEQTIWVWCSERGKNPYVITFELEDEYGQVADEVSTSITVDYSTCDGP